MDGIVDIYTIIFLVIAVLIFLRLRSVLGRRTGSERPPFDPFTRREAPHTAAGEDKVIALPRRPSESGDAAAAGAGGIATGADCGELGFQPLTGLFAGADRRSGRRIGRGWQRLLGECRHAAGQCQRRQTGQSCQCCHETPRETPRPVDWECGGAMVIKWKKAP